MSVAEILNQLQRVADWADGESVAALRTQLTPAQLSSAMGSIGISARPVSGVGDH